LRRSMTRNVLLAGTTFGVALLAVAAVVISHGSALREMDWNEDGSTSLTELIAAVDIGERNVVVDGEECIEHFGFKDGLPVRTDCPSGRHVAQTHER